ncbi:response regulator [bacterium]|nr:response regulator [bacterium]
MTKAEIAVVQEDQTARGVIERLIRERGHRAHGANSAARALQLIEDREIDLVVLDMNLGASRPADPRNGLWLCRILKRSPRRIRVILLGAKPSPEAEAEAMNAGADVFLPRSDVRTGLPALVSKLLATPAPTAVPGGAGLHEEQFDKFVEMVRRKKLMKDAEINRVVRLSGRFDRRMGQLAVFLGYIRPADIYSVLLDQSENGGSFGEAACRMRLLTAAQTEYLLRHQRDRRLLFARAAAALGVMSFDQVLGNMDESIAAQQTATLNFDEIPDLTSYEPDLEVQRTIKHIRELASISKSTHQALALLQDDSADFDRIADILEMDPPVAATLLRAVNSAYYGLKHRIDTVKHALVVMGIDRLRSLLIAVLGLSKFKSLPADRSREYWQEAVRTAEWCKRLGVRLRYDAPESLFVRGLLQNVGEMVLWQYFQPQKKQIENGMLEGLTEADAEKSALGMTQADLGGLLFHLWNLPASIVQAAMFHRHDVTLLAATPNVLAETLVVRMACRLEELPVDATGRPEPDALAESERLFKSLRIIPWHLSLNEISKEVEENLRPILKEMTGNST